MAALLEAKGVRIDVAGAAAIDGLSLASTGARLLVLGAGRALFEAAAGARQPRRGELRVEGVAPIDAVRRRIAAAAPLDPPLPPTWTPREYVTWSARLAGHGRGAARALADDALQRLLVTPVATTRLDRAALSVRRATVVAAALAIGAGTLLLDDPFDGLPDDVAAAFGRAVVGALGDRRSALFCGRAALSSPMAAAADEAIVLDGSRVAVQGPPAEVASRARAVAVRVAGDARAFAEALAARGALAIGAVDDAPIHQLTLELGQIGTLEVLRLAKATSVVVLELRPIARAFA
jgi:ABC-type multidrug transport system ATPase subunit